MQTKSAVMAYAQKQANASSQAHLVCNLNPYGSQWVCRTLRAYDPRTDHNKPDLLFIQPAPNGCYILHKNGRPAMDISGKVIVWLDSQQVQTALEIAHRDGFGRYTYQPIEIQELADREWRYNA
jgi:hypothetical protein